MNARAELMTEFMKSYHEARFVFGDDFDKKMADMAIEIIGIQYTCSKQCTFNNAAGCLLASFCDEENSHVPEEDTHQIIMSIEACIVWKAFDEDGLDEALKALGI